MSDDNEKIVATDRYIALGIPYPDPATMCHGECEGTGCIPVHRDEKDDTLRALWNDAHNGAGHDWQKRTSDCDGWHFVMCPSCNGTGKRTAAATAPAPEER